MSSESRKVTYAPVAAFTPTLRAAETPLFSHCSKLMRGSFAAPTLAGHPQFDALRGDPAFQELLARAEAGRDRARAAFREARPVRCRP